MIQSMTGFGKSVVSLPDKKITIELRALNSKRFDLHARVPSAFRERELAFHKLIATALDRGKIEFTLSAEQTGGATATQVDVESIRYYMDSLRNITGKPVTDELALLQMALGLPDAVQTRSSEIGEAEYVAIENGLKTALKNLNEYRSAEGKALAKDFELRLKNITAQLAEVEKMDANRLENTKDRLRKAIEDIGLTVDGNRFEQELVYYIEKFDITEERTRLHNHLSYFSETLHTADSNGRKLNFISQEMGREINTIGSKSNYAPMQALVVQMKDELEKIKEQVLNVL